MNPYNKFLCQFYSSLLLLLIFAFKLFNFFNIYMYKSMERKTNKFIGFIDINNFVEALYQGS